MLYFFNFFERDLTIVDDAGLECADFAEAHARAIEAARDIMADALRYSGEIDLKRYIEICDETGHPVGTVRFEEALLAEP